MTTTFWKINLKTINKIKTKLESNLMCKELKN